MERKIGEIFEVDGQWYQCVQGNCEVCDFSRDEHTCLLGVSNCVKFRRNNDCKAVAFKKLEKVGEPYVGNNRTFQLYKLAMPIHGDIPDQITAFTMTEVVIKQNKEDMEEKKTNFVEEIEALCKRYNMSDGVRADFISEIKEIIKDKDKKHSLKPFDLEAAKQGKPVCTRDGRKARIICFDKKKDIYPLIVLVTDKDGYEIITSYKADSVHPTIPNDDLMMLPEKKEGWVNIYKSDNGTYYTGAIFYEKNDALVNTAEIEITTGIPRDCIDTVKINWEE